MSILKKILVLAFVISSSSILFSQTRVIDNFDDLSTWQKSVSDGAKMSVSLVDGLHGKAIKIDYQFTGSGYCGIVKKLPMNLPTNYKFSFSVKGNSPKNNLEFKLDDSTGDNVWWYVFKRFDFPNNWTEKTIRKRNITFAWGPKAGGDIHSFNKIELIISAADGGSGTIYLDDLSFEQLPVPIIKNVAPIVEATSTLQGKPSLIFDNNLNTSWRSKPVDKQSLTINFQYTKEYGGLIIHWDSLNFATDYNIESSNDLKNWKVIYSAKDELRKISFIPFGDYESNYLRINFFKSSRGKGYAIKEINIEDYRFSEDDNYRFEQIAKEYPKGYFPKYFLNKQTYWDIIGVSGGNQKGLINEEGMIETSKEGCSVEPFIYYDNKFVTWNDVSKIQKLENNYLPIPSVKWINNDLNLDIKAIAEGTPSYSTMYIRYTISNRTSETKTGKLYLAIRPFQVNPPWQNLNTTGGVSKINSIDYDNSKAIINNDKEIISVTPAAKFGAVDFREGSIIDYISKNSLPDSSSVKDNDGFASGAFEYPFKINSEQTLTVILEIPFYKSNEITSPSGDPYMTKLMYHFKSEYSQKQWSEKLNKVTFNLPPSENKLINTLRSNLAYILINQDENALQPGSRCYDRSWIRDGALMSESLLKMGITSAVKNFINWYSNYQFPSGKIPCAVDKRGADPVPENDSQGEYIYLLKEYFNFTKDTSMLEKHWNNIKSTVNYIKFQIGEESTEQNKNGTDEQKSFYGLVPASISHEGYSAKPMHSYWDDFFVLKGLKDAVSIAEVLEKKNEIEEYSKLRDEFRKNLYHSINLAMKNKKINYIPGCAELGDFDATSTTIAVSPCGELKYLPEPALQNTFNKYFENFKKRLNPKDNWINYTPYEIRVAETFVYLNELDRTYDLLNFFFKDQRPEGWNHWAEVVWKNKDNPKFIGDMPHTWVGSAYINAVRALFVYEDEDKSALIIGAGVEEKWLADTSGISVGNLPTYYGPISYSIKKIKNQVTVEINSKLDSSCKEIILKSPVNKKIKKIIVDGKESGKFNGNNIFLKRSDKKIVINF
ncbi:MAG: discoidin domain-containing protein [Bacteroidetes bacterium]|nr:discoidin domain-containing protein [Bacteroidota bacterium]